MSHAYGVKNWSKGPARVYVTEGRIKRDPWVPKFKLIKLRDIKAAKAKLAAARRAKAKPLRTHEKKKRQKRRR